jgi:hypothetical protein
MKLLDWLKSGVLVSVIVFLGFGSFLIYRTIQTEETLVPQISATISAANTSITHINSTIDQANKTLSGVSQTTSEVGKQIGEFTKQASGVAVGLQKTVALVNAPCVPGPCGTVADVAKTLNTSRLAIGQVEIAVNSFDKNQDRFYQQEDKLYADADQSFNHFDSLLTSSDLAGSIHNFNTISSNLGQTTTDFQTKFHSFLYPPPCKGFRCYIKTGYEAIKIGAQLAEPSYYFWAMTAGARP